ncbi:MAG: HAD family hydrolase [Piscirickettsiaceae bacterium]|nr:HAD family hydrolase [Piscirickettsiaceae bacterium]
MSKQKIYALDFDGVICDSAVETGITGWKVAHQLWPEMSANTPAEMIDLFRQVRPVMETGYEAILIMRLLFKGISAQTLLDDFANRITQLINHEQLAISQLKILFGETRDHWINHNLNEWVEMNPLFDGFAEKLKLIDAEQCYIITTKQERFVSQILSANNIPFPAERIFGLDRKMSKPQILSKLIKSHPEHIILFVEDRLPTLINVADDEQLGKVKLFFANWGYNTQHDKSAVKKLPITVINLSDFSAL